MKREAHRATAPAWIAALLTACAAAPAEWDSHTRAEVGSTRIVVGTLEGDANELLRTAREEPEYVWLWVRVEETLKGPEEESVPFRFFSTAESNRRGRGEPSGLEMAERIGERWLVSLVEVEGAAYSRGSKDVPGLRPATPEAVESARALVAVHEKLQARELEVDARVEADVVRLIGGLTRDPATQRANLLALEELGLEAVPAIARHMDSREVLAEDRIQLANRSDDAFESHRTYGVELVVDALAAVLDQMTYENFGLGGNEADREASVRAWRVYAHYVAAGRVPPR